MMSGNEERGAKMYNTINAEYMFGTYLNNQKKAKPAEVKEQTGGFLEEVGKKLGEKQAQTERVSQTENVSQTEAVSLEDMLRAKYPGIKYHVFDASSSYWRTRNDYPHHLLYQEGPEAAERLENWKPEGPNPNYADAKEVRAGMASIPPGSKAVVIHPKVQERMEQDPEYAKEIMERIETWFTFDLLRNEAIMPGHSMELSQCIAIGEDGSMVNAVTSSPPRITYSGDPDGKKDFWEIRTNRHARFMRLWQEKQIAHGQEISRQFAVMGAQAAKAKLAEMLQGDTLKNIFGDTMAGNPTEAVLSSTRELVWG